MLNDFFLFDLVSGEPEFNQENVWRNVVKYNPFNKAIGDKLELADIQGLITDEVTEGYFVEYKSEFPKEKGATSKEKIAKSIASLANTYGGWYIVGVEADRTQNKAINALGFEHPDPISTVREVVRTHISPIPIFFPQVILITGSTKKILAVYVPGGQDTPFICKDGTIYRRVSDSSDPTSEKDRNAVDRLINNGQALAKQFELFVGRSGAALLKVTISPYPLGTIDKPNIILSKSIEELLEISRGPLKLEKIGEISFNDKLFKFGRPTYNSVKLSQTPPEGHHPFGLSVEFFDNGRAKFNIPINVLYTYSGVETNVNNSGQIEKKLDASTLNSVRVREKLLSIFAQDSSNIRLFDIGRVWFSIAYLIAYYQKWLGDDPPVSDLQIAVTYHHQSAKLITYLDMDEWVDLVEKHGVPAHAENIQIPEDNIYSLRMSLENKTPLWQELCGYIGRSFGLAIELDSNLIEKTITDFLSKKVTPLPIYKKE